MSLLLNANNISSICAGVVTVAGLPDGKPVQITNAGGTNDDDEEVQKVTADGTAVICSMGGRAYFSNDCDPAHGYDHTAYTKLPLLGKAFSYTTSLAGAGCGCNAALYLVSMAQNTDPTECGDYYCDANNVCGVRCAEIDIQEANEFAWHSTLHVYDDNGGSGGGYGGGGDGWSGPRDWKAADFNPGEGSDCIDTSREFDVRVGFPVDGDGRLTAVTVTLTQGECTLESSGLDSYTFDGRDGMSELSDALSAGMTPVMSYWSSDDMLWLDGKGQDGLGQCDSDDASACGASVSFYNFALAVL